jgi:hypothetical protein
MFKIGDKIVCIHSGYFDYGYSHYKDVSKKLKLYEIYTIENIKNGMIYVFDITDGFTILRFISLKEYRKQKLNKICSK